MYVHLLYAGSLLVTAGGNHLCVWDIVGGGRLLHKLTTFQKTVTCVKVSPMAGPASAAAPRLLAGSLDGHVKVSMCVSVFVSDASDEPASLVALSSKSTSPPFGVGFQGYAAFRSLAHILLCPCVCLCLCLCLCLKAQGLSRVCLNRVGTYGALHVEAHETSKLCRQEQLLLEFVWLHHKQH